MNHHHGLHPGGVEAVPGRGDQAPGQAEKPLAAAAGHGHCHDYPGEVGEQGELLLVHPPPGEQVHGAVGGGQRLVHQALLLEVVQGGGGAMAARLCQNMLKNNLAMGPMALGCIMTL